MSHLYDCKSFLNRIANVQKIAIFIVTLRKPLEGDAENHAGKTMCRLLAALEQDNLNTVFMNWIILILAGLMEVGFTFCLGKTKTAAGQEQVWWWAGFLVSLSLSMYLMAKAAERLPIGTVYPVWTGIGAVGAVIVGIVFFNEPATFWRIFFITTLILSIIGLKVLA